MAENVVDVIGIGNAIVDVLTHSSEDRLAELKLQKGAMTLIDSMEADALYKEMGAGVECSGGSAANTIAGIAALGGDALFIGKVKNDEGGRTFQHDLTARRVRFPTKMADDGRNTARCLIFITPDGQRTMQTYLGACIDLTPDDVDPDLIRNAKITYLEGYLWDPPKAREAFKKAAKIAHEAGRKIALSLSDPFCVERHRAELVEFVEKHVDILFANEHEIASLYQTDFESAAKLAAQNCEIAVLTKSAEGSIVMSGERVVIEKAQPVEKVVDTTGAGDLYAAGFLFGLSRNLDLAVCARYGSICAAEIISHDGARPVADLPLLINNLSL